MDFVRRAEWIFWAFVVFIVAITTATIIIARGYIWPLIDLGDWLFYAGIALMVCGYSFRRYAMAVLGRAFSNILQIKHGQTLICCGIYAKVRHPAYTGTLVMVAGIPLVFSSVIGLLPVSLALPAVLYRISVEERMLKEKFGEEYADYINKTKMLVPYLI